MDGQVSQELKQRIRRPPILILLAILTILIPVFNIVALVIAYALPVAQIPEFLSRISHLAWIMYLMPIAIGVGLLSISRIGWILFVIYTPMLVAFNIYTIVTNPTPYNIQAVFSTLFGMTLLAYFLRRDVFAPYLAPETRGFRDGRRQTIDMEVEVDGTYRPLVNLSVTGAYLYWPDCILTPDDAVEIKLVLEGESFTLIGDVARLDKAGVGLSFNSPPRTLKTCLAKHASKRRSRS